MDKVHKKETTIVRRFHQTLSKARLNEGSRVVTIWTTCSTFWTRSVFMCFVRFSHTPTISLYRMVFITGHNVFSAKYKLNYYMSFRPLIAFQGLQSPPVLVITISVLPVSDYVLTVASTLQVSDQNFTTFCRLSHACYGTAQLILLKFISLIILTAWSSRAQILWREISRQSALLLRAQRRLGSGAAFNTYFKNSWRFTSSLPRVIMTSCWRTRIALSLRPKRNGVNDFPTTLLLVSWLYTKWLLFSAYS